MWKFSGKINYECSECGHSDAVNIEDFDVECIGGDERGMGAESIYELIMDVECNDCNSEINFKFTASEYPVEVLNYVDGDVTGAITDDEPYIKYLPDDLYEARYFDVAKATAAEIIREIQADKDLLRDITSRQFEEVVAELFRDKGYQVELTKRTRDGGKDIIAISKDDFGIRLKYFIECKHYAEEHKVGVDVVRSLQGVKNTKNGPNKTIIATTSSFTADAINFVEKEATSEWDMTLADYDHIIGWIKKYRKDE